MSYEKAIAILNDIRDGRGNYSLATINKALELTGDLEIL